MNKIARSVEKRGGRRESYLSVSAEKAQVAIYSSTHNIRTAIKHFSKAFGKDLKKTVQDPGHEIKKIKNKNWGLLEEAIKNSPPQNFRLYRGVCYMLLLHT